MPQLPKLPTVALVISSLLLLAACGSTSTAAKPSPKASATPQVSGTANVAYAGSLQLLMQDKLGPAFTGTTGIPFVGTPNGSLLLAQEILSGEISPNVFISVGNAAMDKLEPSKTSWAVRFASSPLVVAYYPSGPHATELDRIASGKLPLKDLFELMATPGFRLGRTDPATDPQGEAFAMMVPLAVKLFGLPSSDASTILGGSNPSSQYYPEDSLDSELQAGQLDAASAFLPQAVQLGIPYISLPSAIDFGDPADLSSYVKSTLTISPGGLVHGFLLDDEVTEIGTGDSAAAQAFIDYLISPAGRKVLDAADWSTPPPSLLGVAKDAPSSIREAVKSS